MNNQDSQDKLEILPNDSPIINYHYKDVKNSVDEEEEDGEVSKPRDDCGGFKGRIKLNENEESLLQSENFKEFIEKYLE